MNKPSDKCKYALCSHCYIKKETIQQGKRSRLTIIRNTKHCNHNNLEVFAESDYFKPEFVRKRHERGDIFPTECAECQRAFWHKPIKRTI